MKESYIKSKCSIFDKKATFFCLFWTLFGTFPIWPVSMMPWLLNWIIFWIESAEFFLNWLIFWIEYIGQSNIESNNEWIIFWQNSNIELNQKGYRILCKCMSKIAVRLRMQPQSLPRSVALRGAMEVLWRQITNTRTSLLPWNGDACDETMRLDWKEDNLLRDGSQIQSWSSKPWVAQLQRAFASLFAVRVLTRRGSG